MSDTPSPSFVAIKEAIDKAKALLTVKFDEITPVDFIVITGPEWRRLLEEIPAPAESRSQPIKAWTQIAMADALFGIKVFVEENYERAYLRALELRILGYAVMLVSSGPEPKPDIII